MAEYIERDKLAADFELCNKQNPRWTPQRVASLIARANAADVVEVVRCEDCGYSIEDGFWCTGCGLMPGHATLPNKWCAEGERKDGEG